MSFLNPFFLLALAALSVPLLIYLWRRRPPGILDFPTLRFLQRIRLESRRRFAFPRWSVLLLRMGALACLAIALAGPYLPPDDGRVDRGDRILLGVMVDNSPGMDRHNSEGRLFDQAVAAAADRIQQLDPEDRVLLGVTNGPFPQRPLLPPHAAIRELEALEPVRHGSFWGAHLEELLDRMARHPEMSPRLLTVTDAQAARFDATREPDRIPEIPFPQSWLVVGSSQGHTALTGFDLLTDSPQIGEPAELNVRLARFGDDESHPVRVVLREEDRVVSSQSLTVGGEAIMETVRFEWVPQRSATRLQVELEGSGQIFDSTRYLSVHIPAPARIAYLGRQEPERQHSPLYTLLQVISSQERELDLQRVDWEQLTLEGEDAPDLLILDAVNRMPVDRSEEILEWTRSGGALFLLPAPDGQPEEWMRLLEGMGAFQPNELLGEYGREESVARVAPLRRDHPALDRLFGEEVDRPRVELPELYARYRLESATGVYLPVLETESGEPLLVEQPVEEGRLLLSAFGFDRGWSDLGNRPLFAPLVYSLLRHLAGIESEGLYRHRLGEAFERTVPFEPGRVRIEVDGEVHMPGQNRTFGGTRVHDDARSWEPGFVRMFDEEGGKERWVAVNIDTMEYDLQPLEEQTLQNRVEQHWSDLRFARIDEGAAGIAGGPVRSAGREIWHWFLLIGILLLVVESLFSQRNVWKTNP